MDAIAALDQGNRASDAPTSGFIRRTRLVAQAPKERVALERAAAAAIG
jgi:hypothetical protein